MNPHIFRTHDGGKTWTEIVAGIPGGARSSVDPRGRQEEGSALRRIRNAGLRVVRRRRSLGVAAPEHGGVVGARSAVIKDDDLVAGTHGRGIWILDDITPLRQIDATTARTDDVLFKPQTAWRVRWNMNTDTPLPPDEPRMPNPPEGAIINYYLKSDGVGSRHAGDPRRGSGKVVRRYSSEDEVFPS